MSNPPDTAALTTAWDDLAHPQAARGRQAVEALIAMPEKAVGLLRQHLRPIAAADPKRLARWIDGLGSDDFAERDQAQRELDRLGDLAAAALRQALAGKQPLETRRRVEALLRKRAAQALSPEQCRHVRAVQVLECIGNAAARDVLRALARGAAGVRLTEEANTALARLDRRH